MIEGSEGVLVPEDTDPLAQVAEWVRNAVEGAMAARQHGRSVVNLAAAHTGSVAVTFPFPFAEIPDVVCTPTNINYLCSISGIGVNGFTINIRHYQLTTTTAGIAVHWHASGKIT